MTNLLKRLLKILTKEEKTTGTVIVQQEKMAKIIKNRDDVTDFLNS